MVRPEIQGLRALAVGLVVLFHLFPGRVSGGYVGVDVFFVISGYLITQHIHRELEHTGTVSLRSFWARRIRRLLPASLLVLAVSLVAVVLWVPATIWVQTARQVAASALYVQNWALARDAVDYMAANNIPTVVQHYWSLSVEEQFYLVWPVLVLLFAARRPGRAATRRIAAGLAVLATASLVWSVVATAHDPSAAYFVTTTRCWEFGAGALLALASIDSFRRSRLREPAAAAGLIAVVAAGVLFDDRTPFPGYTALLPVLGTAAVIAGADPARGVGRLLAWRPATFVGDVSYSVYLWHWPLIVVWPYATHRSRGLVDSLVIGIAAVVLAWLTKVLVEDPGRTGRLLAAAPWRSFAFAVLGMAVVVAATASVQIQLHQRAVQAERRLASNDPPCFGSATHDGGSACGHRETGTPVSPPAAKAPPCFGPAALDPGSGCVPQGTGPLTPPPEVVTLQNTKSPWPGCEQGMDTSGITTCTLGSESATPDRTVAIVGDSHASQWFGALDELGKERNWRVLTFTRSSCPLTRAVRVLANEPAGRQAFCVDWNDDVTRRLLGTTGLSYVFTASFTSAYEWQSRPDEPLADPRVDGFVGAWEPITRAGLQVFALRDIPRTQGTDVPTCLANHAADRMACATARADGLKPSAIADAAARVADDPRVHLVDLSDRFCDAQWCYPVAGDLIVYRDFSHLSAEYSRALAPYLDAAVRQFENPANH